MSYAWGGRGTPSNDHLGSERDANDKHALCVSGLAILATTLFRCLLDNAPPATTSPT